MMALTQTRFFTRRVLVIWISILSFGCSSAEKIENIGYPLSDIQKAVAENLPGGIGSVSSNQRVYTSNFFSPILVDRSRTPTGLQERARAKVYVLGDRRPYSVEVEVELQERTDHENHKNQASLDLNEGSFETIASDKGLARRIVRNIHEYLVKKSKNKNIIDDFKPF
jgi:hypothetical protein